MKSLRFAPNRKFGRVAAWLALLASAGAAGCNRNHPPPIAQTAGPTIPTSTGIPPLSEQKLDPLTQSDVDMYLSVLRAAAARVQSPTPEDKATVAQAQQIIAGAAAGHVPSSSDARTLQHASQIGTEMDQIVAEDRNIDAATYLGVALAIEAVVPEPDFATSDKKPAEPSAPPSTPLERRIADVNSTNRLFLAPYQNEIEELLAVIRNPANLPKS